VDIQGVYAEVGRKVPPGKGICHGKVVVAGPYAIIGSTNWTTSSKCNAELSVLMFLKEAGFKAIEAQISRFARLSVPFDEDASAAGERARAMSRERRSRSLPRG